VGRAGGNPFYLEEIIRDLIAEGVLVQTGDGWACADRAAGVEVPVTVQGLILSRLDRLPAPARRLAQEAAVLGPAFSAPLLRRVASDPAGWEAGVRLMEDAGLVQPIADPAESGRYGFGHALVQETIYQNVLVRRRMELHGQAGRALETLSGGGERPARLEDLEALGHHF